MSSVDFTDRDILVIYGHFMKKLKKLEMIQSAESNPIHPDNVEEEIQLFTSITSKIEKSNPGIVQLGQLM